MHEDFSTPLVSLHQWFAVGSRHERPGMTGMAHFFEHLMFKGTSRYSGHDFEHLIQANGGTNNAFTSLDYTGYYVDLPASKLELILDMESDRMINLVFEPKRIESEREVVKEERRFRYDNNVNGYMNEAVFSSVFKVHPYRWPVIGYMKDLNSITIEQFKEFYRTHYAPNNSVLVIAGAVKTEHVKKLVDKYYGKLEAQEIPKTQISPEPEQKGQRRTVLKKSVQNPYLAVAYKSVAAGHSDQYAFDLLSNILSEGTSSRLYRRLVYKEQSVTSIFAYAYTPQDPGIFEVFAAVKPGYSTNSVLRSISAELARLQSQLVSESELEKAKNQVMKSYVDSLKTISGKARALASNEVLFGSYLEMFNDLDKYLSVTREQIQNVAKKYLNSNQKSVVLVVPKVSMKKGS